MMKSGPVSTGFLGRSPVTRGIALGNQVDLIDDVFNEFEEAPETEACNV